MKVVRHTYRTSCATVRQPPGFGDYLRGSIGLAVLAIEQKFSLEIDLSHHPAGAFLRDKRKPIALPGEVFEFFNERSHLLPEFLANLGNNESVTLTTHFSPDMGKVTDAVRELVRSQLEWDESIEAPAEGIRKKISDGAFAVLHVRVADNRFHARRVGVRPLCSHIEKHVLPVWHDRLAVISNNQAVKKALSERYGLPLVSTGAVHLGECNGMEAAVRDTVIDFAVMSKAIAIFSCSEYAWNSGFSRWCACLHGVPFSAITLPSNPVSRMARSFYSAAARTFRAISG
jgi:hypothetical protein